MNRTFIAVSMAACASAINLSAELQKTWAITDRPWNADGAFVDAAIAAGTPFSDVDFKPVPDSLGNVGGDTANQSLSGNMLAGVEWKRVSEIMTGVTHTVFSPQSASAYSTLQQGSLGSCYLLAAFVGLDARPGALEEIFYTKTINAAGIYAINLYMNGRRVVVHVDDYIPVKMIYRFGRTDW